MADLPPRGRSTVGGEEFVSPSAPLGNVNDAKRPPSGKLSYLHRHDRALRESEQGFRSLFERAGDGIWVHDVEGHVLAVNPSALRRLGFSQSEVTRIQDVDAPVDARQYEQRVQQLKDEGRLVFEGEHIAKSGERVPVEVNAQIVEFQGRPAILSVVRDLSERRKAEKMLRESEEKYRLFYTNSPLGYQSLDGEGKLLEVNPVWLEVLGYGKEDIIGRWFGDFLTKPYRDTFAQHFEDFKKSGEIHSVEYEMIRKDGRRVFVEFDGRIGRDSQGRFMQTHCVMRDVTRQKQIDRKRREIQKRLEEKNRELESILRISSHDLRTPLVNIQGFSRELDKTLSQAADMLSAETASQKDWEQLRKLFSGDLPTDVRFIQNGVDRMNELLDGLLRLARLGKAATYFAAIDMNDLIEGVVQSLTYKAHEYNVVVKVDPLPHCVGDSEQIGQVFSNLVSNAIKYMDPLREGRIHISGRQDDHEVVYRVEDNGIGIDPENCERIFEVFYRACPEKGEGDGLGLAIVRRILDRHEGRAWCESQVGHGSIFFVSLPLREMSRQG